MRFTPTSVLSLFLATALAAPSALEPRVPGTAAVEAADLNFSATMGDTTVTAAELTQFSELAEAYSFAATAKGCSPWKCAGLLLKVPCMVGAISDANYLGVLECASTDTVSSWLWGWKERWVGDMC